MSTKCLSDVRHHAEVARRIKWFHCFYEASYDCYCHSSVFGFETKSLSVEAASLVLSCRQAIILSQFSECCAHRHEPPHTTVISIVANISVASYISDIFLIALKSPLFISLVNIPIKVLQSCLETNNPTLSLPHIFDLQTHLSFSWYPFEGTSSNKEKPPNLSLPAVIAFLLQIQACYRLNPSDSM